MMKLSIATTLLIFGCLACGPMARVIAVDLDGPINPLSPSSVQQGADGTIRLRVADVDLLTRTHKQVTAQPKTDGDVLSIGYSTQALDCVRWNVAVNSPGEFVVSIDCATVPVPAGGHLILSANGQILNSELQSTGGLKTFRIMRLGKFYLTDPGLVTVTIHSDGIKTAFCNLRGITFTPSR